MIMSRKVTGLCSECHNEIPCELFTKGDSVVMVKKCPIHGESEVLIDPDAETYKKLYNKHQTTIEHLNVVGSTILNVTDRCNLSCHNCYHPVDQQSTDPSIDEVVEEAKQSKGMSIIFMGAEPTMRDDLPALISAVKKATGKMVLIYTNGIKLADKNYIKELLAAGLTAVCFSMHTRSYNNDLIHDQKIQALDNMVDMGVGVHHISFTLSDMSEIPEVAQIMRDYWNVPHHWRLRAPAAIGKHTGSEYSTTFINSVIDGFSSVNWCDIELMNSDNNPYHVNLKIEGSHVRCIRWASVHDVILDDLGDFPTARFIKGKELNFMHAAILQSQE